jgi:glyoxylase-like metal-dependent hydrolase (beta-lactamase superfamily II)
MQRGRRCGYIRFRYHAVLNTVRSRAARRKNMRIGRSMGTAAALAAFMLIGAGSQAAAPFSGTQSPGYYRMKLGDFEITALTDGTFMMPVGKMLTNVSPAELRQALESQFLRDPLALSVNGFLINTGAKLVLVDTGIGAGEAGFGNLVPNLRASGYQPEQVDEIYITHMHGDHIGGLTADGHAVFPNAVVRADKREADYWLSQANLNTAAKDRKGGFEGAQKDLAPYIAAGRFKTFDGATDLIAGVRSLPAYGHTPGHSNYVVESKGEKLVLWGDLMHVAAVQFPDPAVTILFDSDSTQAATQRQKVFADAASQGFWVGGAHLAFPGLGHLTKAAAGYAWVPVNYPQPSP